VEKYREDKSKRRKTSRERVEMSKDIEKKQRRK